MRLTRVSFSLSPRFQVNVGSLYSTMAYEVVLPDCQSTVILSICLLTHADVVGSSISDCPIRSIWPIWYQLAGTIEAGLVIGCCKRRLDSLTIRWRGIYGLPSLTAPVG